MPPLPSRATMRYRCASNDPGKNLPASASTAEEPGRLDFAFACTRPTAVPAEAAAAPGPGRSSGLNAVSTETNVGTSREGTGAPGNGAPQEEQKREWTWTSASQELHRAMR